MKKLASRLVARTARVAQPVIARLTRPLTMGVRAMIFDAEGRVMLVRHSYTPGWHMPGGAIEPRETAHHALIRETHEETGLAITGRAELFALYLNVVMARRDHIALYVVRSFTVTDRAPSAWEIVEFGFHRLDDLPAETTGPTRRRLAEVLERRPPDELW